MAEKLANELKGVRTALRNAINKTIEILNSCNGGDEKKGAKGSKGTGAAAVSVAYEIAAVDPFATLFSKVVDTTTRPPVLG